MQQKGGGLPCVLLDRRQGPDPARSDALVQAGSRARLCQNAPRPASARFGCRRRKIYPVGSFRHRRPLREGSGPWQCPRLEITALFPWSLRG